MKGNKTVYKLGVRVQSSKDKKEISHPKKIRLWLSQLQDAQERNNLLVVVRILSELSNFFLEAEDWAKVIEYSKKELEKSAQLPTSKRLEFECAAFFKIGRACREIEEYDAAIQYQRRYLSVAEKMNERKEILNALFDLGLTHLQRGESENGTTDDFKVSYDFLRQAAKRLPSVGIFQLMKRSSFH